MSEFDDLFTPQESKRNAAFGDQPFDKEAWAQQKKEQRELVYGMIDNAAQSVAGDGLAFQKYLDVQSQFGRYSVSNALLILAQKPDATVVRDFDSWKEQGAYIRKNEAGFYILEPGDEYEREDGTTGVSYNPKKVFDISQTGLIRRKETPAFPDERTRLKALMDHAPVPIIAGDTLPERVNALYNPEAHDILVRRGMDGGSIFRALAQELTHAQLDSGDGSYQRSAHGFHAYCAAYMLCRQYGVETESFRFDRAPEMFAGMEPQQVRAQLTTIKETASEISGRMERFLNQQRQQKRSEPER
jgi:hypothetical protein